MAVATFDTLKFANTLKAGGVPPEQAEAQTAAFAEIVQTNFKELATHEDIALVRGDLERITRELRAEIDRFAKELRTELDRVAKAAKEDLDQAVKDLKRDNADLKTELKHEMQTIRTKHDADLLLLKWMVGVTFTGVLTIIGLIARLLFVMGR